MSLEHLGYIDLPPHIKPGGFDHAAVHRATARVYVAHTANDALDVIDGKSDRYLYSIPSLAGVAGALVSEERDLVFTSNRAENSVGIFSPGQETSLFKVPVGVRPNGLAYDPGRNLLLAANVGDPAVPNSFTVSIVDVGRQTMTAGVAVPGRTRWAVYGRQTDAFYVNIADPAEIAVIDAGNPAEVARTFAVPAAGPHGLDLDAEGGRLFCACDGKRLIILESRSGRVLNDVEIGGVPDVIFFNPALQHLYVAIGDPGIVEVFDTERMKRLETVQTEKGAHTTAFDPGRSRIYAFLPQTHRAAVYLDRT
jgi:DNA-binding beta-propeller fold protein YncE